MPYLRASLFALTSLAILAFLFTGGPVPAGPAAASQKQPQLGAAGGLNPALLYTLGQSIPNPAAEFNDQFGVSVAALGGNIIVGAYLDDPGATPVIDAGSVYLFDGTTGASLLTIPNPAPAAGDQFGASVAAVGGNILVGANMDDPGVTPVTDAGSAYLFDGATGALLLTIPNPAPNSGDQFGVSVAGVAGNILVGAFQDDPGATPVTDAGSVYLFNGTTGVLMLPIPNPDPADFDRFGISVGAVGSNILVGAHTDNPGGVTDAGSAYILDGATGGLLFTLANPAPAIGDRFGVSVAGVGANALVGASMDDPGATPVADAGSAYLFNGGTGALIFPMPNPDPASGDQFGVSVAALGSDLLVGAYLDDPGATPVTNAGSVYVLSGVTGAPILAIPNPFPAAEDQFGFSIAGAPGKVMAGAPQDDPGAPSIAEAGSAYVLLTDTDEDGVPDLTDNCPTVPNPGQQNNDGDTLGDACDPDDDNDGVDDSIDNCQFTANPGQANAVHPLTPAGDACEDPDIDGVFDAADNCPDNANANQANLDGDALGDVCDPDDDQDAVCDSGGPLPDGTPGTPPGGCAAGTSPAGVDNCPLIANTDQLNTDGDALGNVCDPDDDGDGFSDVAETFMGTDTVLRCGTDGWPPDLAPATRDQTVNIIDIGEMRPVFNSTAPGPPYVARKDLTTDGRINIVDIGTLRPFFGTSCTP